MHQARWLVIYILNEREAEVLENSLRGRIIGMVPRVHFGQLQFSPTVVEYAERCLRTQTFAPAALHEMETELEIRLVRRIGPRPEAAATYELTSAVVEQRPILNTGGSLPLDLGVKLFLDLLFCEVSTGIDYCRDRGIPPELHRQGQILNLPRSRHEACGPEFHVGGGQSRFPA